MAPFFFTMNSFEFLLLKLTGSFLLAKFTPFVILFMIGILFGRIVFLRLRNSSVHKALLMSVLGLMAMVPMSLYFWLFPVYQGDIYSLGYQPKTSLKFESSAELIVVALPGCKYCIESTQLMNKIHKNLPVKVSYWVLGTDVQDAQSFQKLLEKGIRSINAPNQKEILPITKGSFPTYLWVKDHHLKKAWHNDGFGVKALSDICEQ